MASGVEELLDMLYTMIDEAKNVPLRSDQCMIERDRALDILDDVRAQFPMEMREAKKLLNRRTEYLDAAKREAEGLKKQAEADAQRTVSEDRLLAQARQQSNEIVKTAEERARELRRAANEYCEDLLCRAEEAMAEAHEEVKQKRSRFRAASQQAATPQQQPARRAYDAEADTV
ncbi:MAG: hypothetical protein LUE91_00090 [Oscillospiraceae bacterium]|nr:hypothetical protein [Oscillospiraceae bacterium]